ncbi:FecR family protein [Methylophaga sp. OBS3]|uniref:FecR family protein n=1 Tax=Methylophaga sp. OBS3 TaxID=2991934 RepID=UPI002256E0F3|nr:FecR domain-containing protein [Methylophaga sp. OBS3]MCX4189699.1 FecR domain-containing protein [Methylophaga sp. OBS3]
MRQMFRMLVMMGLMVLAMAAHGESTIGTIKTLSGEVSVVRGGDVIDATLGAPLYAQDSLKTGTSGSVGILLHDDARLSLGPDSTMALEQFSFNPQTHDGQASVAIQQGTLSVISGKLTEKRPGALQVKTPAAILAVRGTEFSVKVDPLLTP